MQLKKTATAIGGEIEGVDLSQPVSNDDFDTLAGMFYDRSVVVLRNQQLSPDDLLGFARRFAEPDEHFLGHYALPGYPNILVISNVQADGKAVGFADAGRVWHSDGSYLQTPVAVTMLYAIEIPSQDGRSLGDTEFVSAWSAYSELDAATRQATEGRESVHQVAGRRRATGTGTDSDREREESQPDAIHPLIRVHPVTGRPYVFVNKGECVGIPGMDDDSAQSLITELADAVANTPQTYRHQWQVGDLLLWDNQAVQHVANFDYTWPQHRRLLHRVTIPESAMMSGVG